MKIKFHVVELELFLELPGLPERPCVGDYLMISNFFDKEDYLQHQEYMNEAFFEVTRVWWATTEEGFNSVYLIVDLKKV